MSYRPLQTWPNIMSHYSAPFFRFVLTPAHYWDLLHPPPHCVLVWNDISMYIRVPKLLLQTARHFWVFDQNILGIINISYFMQQIMQFIPWWHLSCAPYFAPLSVVNPLRWWGDALGCLQFCKLGLQLLDVLGSGILLWPLTTWTVIKSSSLIWDGVLPLFGATWWCSSVLCKDRQ